MADGHISDQIMETLRIENLRNEAHSVKFKKPAVMTRHNSRTLLTPVLQCVKAVISEFGGVGMAKNAKDAAIMFGVMLHGLLARTFYDVAHRNQVSVAAVNELRCARIPRRCGKR